ncbi:unnamed protein product [Somion occarium]|uniref:Uncharacterized protein n=1 Tax=Somion occarium TaxID=3059160 RepID=A0ABP1CTW2_9APHY
MPLKLYRSLLYSYGNTITRLLESRSQLDSVKAQWLNPTNILSILTVIGVDVVQRAIAQLAGNPCYFTPVALSFGWLGYALNAVGTVIGEGRLMPPADCQCILVDATTQTSRRNRSWILGRLVRDHETDSTKPGLTLTFYKASLRYQGIPSMDWVYCSGIAVIFIQLGISVIPITLFEDWNVFIVTVAGTVLSLFTGALPKWRKEKWSCRTLQNETDRAVICLTRGNGYSEVLVIISEGRGHFRLEDLALADPGGVPTFGTLAIMMVLFICQLLLLLTIAGLQNNLWFLFAIKSLGMFYNGVAAGIRRAPSTTGIRLEREVDGVIAERKVFQALKRAEERERYVGISLIPIFFPGGLRPDEEQWRKKTLEHYAESKKIGSPISNTEGTGSF